MLKQAVALSFLLVIGIIGSGCASGSGSSGGGEAERSVRPPEGESDLTGVVSGVEGLDSDSSSPARVLVQQRADHQGRATAEETGSSSASGKGEQPRLYLNITDQTRILQRVHGDDGGNLVRAKAAELEEGQAVRAWHGDVVSRSYPGQAQAEFIIIDRASR